MTKITTIKHCIKHSYNYDQQVDKYIDLDSQYMTLKNHAFLRLVKQGKEIPTATCSNNKEDFLNLANTAPKTELEKIVASTFRWIASRNRGTFISSIFAGRYACTSLFIDDMMETGLGVAHCLSIRQSEDEGKQNI